ncbi:unnamed protein product [Lactuca saligna]|uniref:Uncharacterized protein n=1 Tax=Lactuca saligna TaxID=75948 RepID=A0AA35ZT58_LACSI|nr:unnamed protein product [Lactuca saligna]
MSPKYSGIIHEPITTLFSSQSTDIEKVVHEEEPNDDDIMVSFVNLQFDPNEENVPDNLIMSRKEFKILNSKINYLLQIQKQVERLVFHSKSYDYEIQKLCNVAKERHELSIDQVTTRKETVDLKIIVLKSDFSE